MRRGGRCVAPARLPAACAPLSYSPWAERDWRDAAMQGCPPIPYPPRPVPPSRRRPVVFLLHADLHETTPPLPFPSPPFLRPPPRLAEEASAGEVGRMIHGASELAPHMPRALPSRLPFLSILMGPEARGAWRSRQREQSGITATSRCTLTWCYDAGGTCQPCANECVCECECEETCLAALCARRWRARLGHTSRSPQALPLAGRSIIVKM